MAQEVLDKIRRKIDTHNKHGFQGEQEALKWVLKIFKEYEETHTRKVLVEKFKKKESRRRTIGFRYAPWIRMELRRERARYDR